jgi:PAS domain S-box-containing protein
VAIAETLASAAGTIVVSARARQAQAKQSAQLQAIMEHIPSAVVLTDAEGWPVLVSESMRKIIGADPDPGLPLFSPMGHQPASMIRSAVSGQALRPEELPTWRALAGEQVKDILQIRPPGQIGEQCLMVSSTPLRDGSNAISGTLTVMTDVTHETMLQRKVKAYADQLERVYESMACGVMVVSRNGILYANRSARKLLNLPQDGPIPLYRDMLGDLIREDGSEVPLDERPGRIALRTGEAVQGVALGHILPSGDVLWTQEDAVPIADEHGNVELAVVSFVDITERKETREALEDQFEFLRATMASLGDGIYATDENGGLVMMNRAAEEMLGWTQAELFGRRVHEIFHHSRPDGSPLPEEECPIRRVRLEGVTLESDDDVFARRDGTLFPVSHTSAPLRSQGKVTGIVTAFRDVSEQRQAQYALRASEERYRVIVETAFEGVWAIDRSGRTTFANEQMARLLGCTVDQLYQANLYDFIEDGMRASVEARLERRHAGLSERYESCFKRVDGSVIWAMASACPIRNREGEIIGSLAMITDITERKNLEAIRRKTAELQAENERIANTSEVRAQFLATMSHELRSPLNAIIGMAELLNRGSFGPLSERQQDMTGRLLSSGEHLLKLVNGVLDLAKIEAGKLEFEPEPLSLRDLVRETVATLAPQAHAKDVRIEQDVRDGLDHAYLDATRLRQVLYNYLSNAIKFSPNGGSVAVDLAPVSADRFRIEVRDQGPGIAAEDIAKLFREFHQLRNGHDGKERGTGLGLSITRRIVEAQGGQVGVHSEPGQGSVFYAVLPLRQQLQAA